LKTKLGFIGVLVAAAASTQASATDGYFSHGYGVKSQGMGGVAIALPQDALAAAANPAGMGLIGDRADVGITWFRPGREATLSNTGNFPPGPYPLKNFSDGTFEGNNRKDFLIPEGGFNKVITPEVSLGVSIYGNGGMNTDYEKPIPLLNGGTGNHSGIDYIQLFIAPTVAWKVTPTQTVGVAVNLGYQRFKAKGIEGFTGISTSPDNVTGRDHDDAYGIGLHLGWIGQITDTVSLGATYQTRTKFQDFDKYKGLFAGSLDAPAFYGIGIAVKATPQLTVAADIQRILFSDVDPVGNSVSRWNHQINGFNGTGNLGTSSGPGFGWDDATVLKIGASYAYSDSLTLRGGYNHVTQPIPKSETLFNILAPAVIQDHVSLGATWVLSNKGELSFGYTHAFEDSVKGSNTIPAEFGGGDVKLKMHQDSIGIAYGWKL
jgi:long-chain fatty acid transport protein